MFQFSKFRSTGDVHMSTMSGMPGPEDLEYVLEEARKDWRRPIELSIKTPGGTKLLMISAKCDETSGDPLWTLSNVAPTGTQIIWAHSSADLTLIFNLLEAEYSRAASDEESALLADKNAQAEQRAWQPPPAPVAASASAMSTEQSGTPVVDSETLAVQSFIFSICQPETGVLTYPAFLFFVDQEYRRCRRGGPPFSVAVFQMRCRDESGNVSSEPISPQAVHEAARIIGRAKRDIDLLFHFGNFDFVLLLPHTDTNGAAALVQTIESALSGQPLMPAISANRLEMFCGIASVPGDADRLRTLVAAAVQAQLSAIQECKNIVLHRDLNR